MHIRRLAPPDRDDVASLLRSDETFNEEEVAVALELVDSAIRDAQGDYRALVCEVDGRVLGYVCYGPTPMTTATWDLYWIATHKTARGKGIASRLVKGMEADILGKGAVTIRLETSQTEAYGAARTFYERGGYREVGRIQDFYKQDDDLIIFAKRLDAEARSEDAGPAVKVA